LFETLLEKGANPNIEILVGKHRMPLLHDVSTYSKPEESRMPYIQALLKHGAKISAVDSLGYTALDATIAHGDSKVAKLLIDGGADLETPTKRGFTAVLTAISTNNLPMFQYMMEKQTLNLNKQTGPNKLSPLKVAVLNGRKHILYALLQYKDRLDLDQKDDEGNTALHYAVMTNNFDKIMLLKKAGADSRIKNKAGITPLELARATFGAEGQTKRAALEAYEMLQT
jgi:ankyrin repeat protein